MSTATAHLSIDLGTTTGWALRTADAVAQRPVTIRNRRTEDGAEHNEA